MFFHEPGELHSPTLLIVPGLNNSGPRHWQCIWERERTDCQRVDLGMWEQPHRNTWVNKLNAAISAAKRPVILVAHSLGCHAVAWWNALERPGPDGKVAGALLVAPPALEGHGVDSRLADFAPVARERLPFLSILAASQDDPYASFGQARKMARIWGSRLVDAGWIGHINADSNIGNWPYGRYLLDRLLAAVAPTPAAAAQGASASFFSSTQNERLEIGR
ncbi:MAG: alpha/beta hydrolase [Novosphingobium sp.]